MSGYLLDTDTVSLLAPGRSPPDGFVEWVAREETIFLSAVTIQEIRKGIELLFAKGAKAKAAGFQFWIVDLISTYEDLIMPVDAAVAQAAGRLEARSISAGHNCGVADALIAGTAEVHGLTIVTRNRKHFEPLGVTFVSPEYLGSS